MSIPATDLCTGNNISVWNSCVTVVNTVQPSYNIVSSLENTHNTYAMIHLCQLSLFCECKMYIDGLLQDCGNSNANVLE